MTQLALEALETPRLHWRSVVTPALRLQFRRPTMLVSWLPGNNV
jgi:hypothetical protein